MNWEERYDLSRSSREKRYARYDRLRREWPVALTLELASGQQALPRVLNDPLQQKVALVEQPFLLRHCLGWGERAFEPGAAVDSLFRALRAGPGC